MLQIGWTVTNLGTEALYVSFTWKMRKECKVKRMKLTKAVR